MITVVQASSPAEVGDAKALFTEYFEFLNREIEGIQFDDVQPTAGHLEERASLPGRYAPPDGRLFVAYEEGVSAGCVALHKWDEGIGEVKRLWVKPASRGKHAGRLLMGHLITEARTIGYQTLLLSTIDKLKAATALYRSLGFVPTAPYFEPPHHFFPAEIFLRLDLLP